MHLLNCLNPQRVFNKYSQRYVFVPCRECEHCLNNHARFWINRCEKERKQHRYSFFVTLTYDDNHLPILDFGDFSVSSDHRVWNSDTIFYPSKGDDLKLTYGDFEILFDDKSDKFFFDNRLRYGGIPYISTVDLQKFLKRLNKYIHDKITQSYQNFRYFICGEYGSGCFRPHFHAIFFVDDSKVSEQFEQCIFRTWRQGRIDCQYVEKSACSYVANYCNKSADLPSFYKKGKIRQRFFFSRFPTIGDVSESDETLQELFNNPVATRVEPDFREPEKLIDVPLSSSVQNRLFPKCFSYCSVSDSTRIELYNVVSRFHSENPRNLELKILNYVWNSSIITEFDKLLEKVVRDAKDDYNAFINWVHRVFYVSRRVVSNSKKFGVTLFQYYLKILEYWKQKELYCLRLFYTFQEQYAQSDCDSLILMYPEFCYQNFGSLKSFIRMFEPQDVQVLRFDAKFRYEVSHKTSQKNDYIDKQILKSENKYIYSLIKNYHYAKERYEIG